MAKVRIEFEVELTDELLTRAPEVVAAFGKLADHNGSMEMMAGHESWRMEYVKDALVIPGPRCPLPGVRIWAEAGSWERKLQQRLIPALFRGLGSAKVVEIKPQEKKANVGYSKEAK